MSDFGTIRGFRDTPTELDDNVLLVIETETERRCALIVDILAASEEAMHAVPEMVSDRAKAFISGVVLIEDRMICRLDLTRVVPTAGQEAA